MDTQHELSILTNDGWVITLLADQPLSFDDAVISSIIVQPKEDYAKGLGQRGFGRQRRMYRLNRRGVVVYQDGDEISL